MPETSRPSSAGTIRQSGHRRHIDMKSYVSESTSSSTIIEGASSSDSDQSLLGAAEKSRKSKTAKVLTKKQQQEQAFAEVEADLLTSFLSKNTDIKHDAKLSFDERDSILDQYVKPRVDETTLEYKDRVLYPAFNPRDPAYYMADGITKLTAEEVEQMKNEISSLVSPAKKAARTGGNGKGKGGNGKKGKAYSSTTE
ncbi:hypothetical protein LTR66_017732 [Elasticomyces elasticus]|nr:hypothetical protein LTR66_017732 [Elasticomyces elasticus]